MSKSDEKESKGIGKIDVTVRKQKSVTASPGITDKDTKAIYLIMLINSTDHVIRKARVNKGPWSPTQLIGRTCNSPDYNNCYDSQSWHELLAVNCGSNVQIDAAWQNPDGTWCAASWDSFYADCQYQGGVIQLVNA